MENEIVWNKIIKSSRFPKIKEFPRKYDLSKIMNIRETGKPNLEQTIQILDLVRNLDYETAVILPEGFLYNVNARTVRKNVKPIMLRRIYTKHEAIENQITPEKLIKEKIEQMRTHYQLKPETLGEDYAGINYLGFKSKESKIYLISDAIRGYLHAKNAGELIEIKRFDTLESFLKNKKTNDKETIQAKYAMRRELHKIKKRRMLTETPEKVRRNLLTKQSERIVKIPSTSEKGKFYRNIKFRLLPQKFPDDKYPELNKEFYIRWFDLKTEPSCNCEEKTWLINNIMPGVIWQCFHEITAYRALINSDWKDGKPITHPDPYIATSPFFKPSPKTIDFYLKLRNQVFTKKENHYGHLDKVYRDIWLLKDVVRGKIDLF
jgi:hypothetical protein